LRVNYSCILDVYFICAVWEVESRVTIFFLCAFYYVAEVTSKQEKVEAGSRLPLNSSQNSENLGNFSLLQQCFNIAIKNLVL
jgi:hypothetical protein